MTDQTTPSQNRSKPVPIRYARPSALKFSRGVTILVRSDIMFAAVQVFTQGGGERNVHSHDALDGFWFVLTGKARFYDLDDRVIAEPGAHEGVFIPRNFPYWFESVGSEPLEILQIDAIDKSVPNRIKFQRETKKSSFERFAADGSRVGQVDFDPADFASGTRADPSASFE